MQSPTIWFLSPVPRSQCYKQVKQKRAEHMMRAGCQVSFDYLFCFLICWHSLNLIYICSLHLHDGQGHRRRHVTKVGKQAGGDNIRVRRDSRWARRQGGANGTGVGSRRRQRRQYKAKRACVEGGSDLPHWRRLADKKNLK